MSDETLTDQNSQDDNDRQSLPGDGVSGGGVSRDEFQAAMKQISEEMQQMGERLKQSSRDSVEYQAKSIEDRLFEKLVENLPEGITLSDVQREVVADAQVEQAFKLQPAESRKAEPDPATQPRVPDWLMTEVASIVQEHGLTGEEPELSQFLEENQDKGLRDVLNGITEVAKGLSAKKEKDVNDTEPSGADVSPQVGGSPPKPDLVQAYLNEMARIAGDFSLSRHGRKSAVKACKAHYKAKGVPVDQIGFGAPGLRDQRDAKRLRGVHKIEE